MTKKELIQVLTDKKIKDNVEVKVLCNRSHPSAIEIAYFDKQDKIIIIETN